MGILNRRNAFLGWLTWTIGKRVLKRKARTAVPAIDPETKRPNRPAIVAALAALGLGAWLARNYLADEGEDGAAGE